MPLLSKIKEFFEPGDFDARYIDNFAVNSRPKIERHFVDFGPQPFATVKKQGAKERHIPRKEHASNNNGKTGVVGRQNEKPTPGKTQRVETTNNRQLKNSTVIDKSAPIAYSSTYNPVGEYLSRIVRERVKHSEGFVSSSYNPLQDYDWKKQPDEVLAEEISRLDWLREQEAFLCGEQEAWKNRGHSAQDRVDPKTNSVAHAPQKPTGQQKVRSEKVSHPRRSFTNHVHSKFDNYPFHHNTSRVHAPQERNPATKQQESADSAPLEKMGSSIVVRPLRSEVILREDVHEGLSDPKPNAYFDTTTGILRVYHGALYGNVAPGIPVETRAFQSGATFPSLQDLGGSGFENRRVTNQHGSFVPGADSSFPSSRNNLSPFQIERDHIIAANNLAGKYRLGDGPSNDRSIPGAWPKDPLKSSKNVKWGIASIPEPFEAAAYHERKSSPPWTPREAPRRRYSGHTTRDFSRNSTLLNDYAVPGPLKPNRSLHDDYIMRIKALLDESDREVDLRALARQLADEDKGVKDGLMADNAALRAQCQALIEANNQTRNAYSPYISNIERRQARAKAAKDAKEAEMAKELHALLDKQCRDIRDHTFARERLRDSYQAEHQAYVEDTNEEEMAAMFATGAAAAVPAPARGPLADWGFPAAAATAGNIVDEEWTPEGPL